LYRAQDRFAASRRRHVDIPIDRQAIYAAGVASGAFDKLDVAYRTTGAKVSRMRKQRSAGATVSNAFTEQERREMT
jgi:hypothetical protein